jgi:Bacteriophage tail sheath protein
MPVTPTYPGVYVEEIPSGVHTITAVGTATAAFVGYTPSGAVNRAVRLTSFADYEREFGGLDRESDVSYAVQQFFLNGGTDAYVVRVARNVATAGVTLLGNLNPVGSPTDAVLRIDAKNPGAYGNLIRIDVDYATTNPESTFNVRATRYAIQNGALVVAEFEQFRNLSMNSRSPFYAPSVIGASSRLITAARPATISPASFTRRGWSLSRNLSALAAGDIRATETRIAGAIDGREAFQITINPAAVTDIATLLTQVQTGIANAGLAAGPGNNPPARLTAERANPFGVPDAAGNFLRITSSQRDTSPQAFQDAEFSSVEIIDAPERLGFGTANGGREREGAAVARPFPSGTVSGDIGDILNTTVAGDVVVTIADNTTSPATTLMPAQTVTVPPNTRIADLHAVLQGLVRGLPRPEAQGATVQLQGPSTRALASGTSPNTTITFANGAAGNVASTARLTAGTGALVGPQQFSLGPGPGSAQVASFAQTGGTAGADGSPPTALEFRGNQANKTGMYALVDVDLFNLLIIPETQTKLTESAAKAVVDEALALCEKRRAFMIVDPYRDKDRTSIAAWAVGFPSKNGAVFFPRIRAADPLEEFRVRPMPASGAIAGVMARIDTSRGVWKAPAGIEATVRGIDSLDVVLNDEENGQLNPRGVNVLRTLPVYSTVIWGSRTLEGDDQKASEWKYLPIRRTALMIEESLFRGTKWVVFEPNDEPLWAQIRLNVGAFMQNLFRRGAFAGRTAREAYFVKCDKSTTTPNDQELGIVNIVVGFAPLKPAEFVILQIQQIPPALQT